MSTHAGTDRSSISQTRLMVGDEAMTATPSKTPRTDDDRFSRSAILEYLLQAAVNLEEMDQVGPATDALYCRAAIAEIERLTRELAEANRRLKAIGAICVKGPPWISPSATGFTELPLTIAEGKDQ